MPARLFTPPFVDPRFEIVAEIDEGGAARVFEVRDRVHQARRALKLATRRGQVRRFRTEFLRLSQLRHPNIVRVHDFGLTREGLPFYTMELVRGAPLFAFAGRRDPEQLGLLTLQALDALATVHARGFVHRDVKPSNLLVVGEAETVALRLIDLGLMVPAGARATAAGTLPYIAPEVARGELVDGRADLFSLGAVLYEALLPDEAALTVEDVARRFVERPVAPTRLNPAISAGLSAFVLRLLEPDPRARFADAETAAAALVKIPGLGLGRRPARAMAERLLRGGAISHRGKMMSTLAACAKRALDERRGATIAIEGAVGTGKTPVLRELALRLNLLGFRVVQPRPAAGSGSRLPALIKAAQALDPLLPLRENFTWPKEAQRGSAALSAFASRSGAALAQSFGQAPTALLLDDVHDIDPVALDVLRSLAQALDDVPILLVCSGDPRSDGVSLAAALGGRALEVQVGPLQRTEVARLAAHRLSGLTLPPPALDRLVRDSQGMPSLVEQTLARLLVDQTIARRGTSFVFVGGRYRPARHADDVISSRMATVGEEVLRVLWGAAVLGREIGPTSVAIVTELSQPSVERGLGELERLEILDAGTASTSASYAFASRSLATAAYQAVPAAARRSLHDRAAAHLLALGASEEERLEHVLRGSDDDAAVDVAFAAGMRAAAVYADKQAIDYFARGYARIKAARDPRAPQIALRLGKLFERTGELDRAASWYEVATGAAAGVDGRIEVEATLGLGAVFLRRGMVNDAERQTTRARGLLARIGDAGLVTVVDRLQAHVARQRGASENAEQLFLDALRAAEASHSESQAVDVLLDLSRLARSRGQIVQTVRYARRALVRARRLGDSASIAEASTAIGRGFLRAGRFASARRALLRALKVSRASGDTLREGAVQRQLGNLKLRLGEFDVAIERYERALDLSRAMRSRVDESACLHNIGIVRGRYGEFRPALVALQAARDLAMQVGDLHSAAYSAVELGQVFVQVGDYDTARASITMALDLAASSGDPVILAEGRALLAWIDALVGGLGTEPTAGSSVLALVERIEDPGNRALALWYLGQGSLARSDAGGAERVAARLLGECEQGGLHDFAAPAGLLTGAAAAVGGDTRRATAVLGEAVSRARAARLKPIEVEGRYWLAMLHAGSDRAAEDVTRAMELTRELALALPEDLRAFYLARPAAIELRRAFAEQRVRLLG